MRIKNQYTQLRHLKDILPDRDIIIQMDFAEDYRCRSQQEVQSAYWSPEQVTIHPIVFYYKEGGKLLHKSMAVISDESKHDAGTIFAILQKAIPYIKSNVENLNQAHYWTDSPTSQYRNKTIFSIVSRHEEHFGVKAASNYFEAGHGKGPCHGIGGMAKQLTDEAVKQEKASIQDFMTWAEENEQESTIKFLFVDKKETEASRAFLLAQSGNLKPVKGTMKIRAVFSTKIDQLWSREISCYCSSCFGQSFKPPFLCDGWKEHSLSKDVVALPKSKKISNSLSESAEKESKEADQPKPIEIKDGDFVAAVYAEDSHVYIGTIVEYDDEDALISCMEHGDGRPLNAKSVLKWPTPRDEVWIGRYDILCLIPKPVPTNITARRIRCKLQEAVFSDMMSLYRSWKKEL